MKKLLAIFTAASLLALTSCAYTDYDVRRAEPTEDEQTATTKVDFSAVMESLEKLQDSYLKNLEITASEMPEDCFTFPDDWQPVTENGLTLYLPPDAEVSDESRGKVYKFTYKGAKGDVCFTAQNSETAELWASSLEKNNENYKKAFESFGLEYDGTKQSIYRNILKITPEGLENADKDTRSSLSMLGGWFVFIKRAYAVEKDGCELFIFDQQNLSETFSLLHYTLNFYDKNHEETVVSISSENEETALRIAVSAKKES